MATVQLNKAMAFQTEEVQTTQNSNKLIEMYTNILFDIFWTRYLVGV